MRQANPKTESHGPCNRGGCRYGPGLTVAYKLPRVNRSSVRGQCRVQPGDGIAGVGVTSMSVSRRNIVGGQFFRRLGASFWGTRRRVGAWMARVLRIACLAGTKPILRELLWHRGC